MLSQKKSHCRIQSRSLKATVVVKDSSRVMYQLLRACRVTLGMVHFRSRSLTQSRVKIEALAMACISRFHSESVREALVLISGRLAEIPYFNRKNRGAEYLN